MKAAPPWRLVGRSFSSDTDGDGPAPGDLARSGALFPILAWFGDVQEDARGRSVGAMTAWSESNVRLMSAVSREEGARERLEADDRCLR